MELRIMPETVLIMVFIFIAAMVLRFPLCETHFCHTLACVGIHTGVTKALKTDTAGARLTQQMARIGLENHPYFPSNSQLHGPFGSRRQMDFECRPAIYACNDGHVSSDK